MGVHSESCKAIIRGASPTETTAASQPVFQPLTLACCADRPYVPRASVQQTTEKKFCMNDAIIICRLQHVKLDEQSPMRVCIAPAAAEKLSRHFSPARVRWWALLDATTFPTHAPSQSTRAHRSRGPSLAIRVGSFAPGRFSALAAETNNFPGSTGPDSLTAADNGRSLMCNPSRSSIHSLRLRRRCSALADVAITSHGLVGDRLTPF